jgi:hypothetical protein
MRRMKDFDKLGMKAGDNMETELNKIDQKQKKKQKNMFCNLLKRQGEEGDAKDNEE